MVRRLPGRQPDGSRRSRLTRAISVAGLIVVALTLSACGGGPLSTIPQDGAPNERIWDVYWFLWIGAAIVFVLVEGLLVYTIFRFRRAPQTAHGRPVPVHGNTKLEILWTIIPAIVLVFIAVPTLQIIAELATPPERDGEEPLEVIVTARQFFFQFEYPELDIQTANTMYIPVGRVIDLKLRSGDVIHSFWVPRLAGKMDTIPGRTNEMWLTAEQPGTYAGECAEFCGVGHALMRFDVEAQTPEDFDAWVQEQLNPSTGGGEGEDGDLAARGQQLAQANGCVGCHSVDGAQSAGPTWQGLFGSEIPLASGETVTADEEYITNSIRNPGDQIHEGFSNIMPAFGPDQLSDEDVQAIIAYMQTLSEGDEASR